MKEIDIPAARENLPQVLAFIDSQLEQAGCPAGVQTQIGLAVEEVFMNIASYAYDSSVGSVLIKVDVIDKALDVVISFTDDGVPYDPLSHPDPSLKTPPKERTKGGWGIFMAKKMMDDMQYECKNGQNVLTIRKSWSADK